VWKYRELLCFLIWRDLKVRYKQTVLGVTWVVLQPLLIMVVFSVLFGFLAKIPSDGIPYPVFTFCALIPWQLFANGFLDASNSLLVNQHLVTKVYFSRLVIPLAAVLARVLDFAFAMLVLFGMMYYYAVAPGVSVCALPLFAIAVLAGGTGVGLWLSALNVRYRDIRHMVPFITQLWFFLTPVAYSSSLIPEQWRFLYNINPMVPLIEGFRWSLLGKGDASYLHVTISLAIFASVFVSGLHVFQRVERTVADVV
jgi:lipopolysaccharide transport system permease protein